MSEEFNDPREVKEIFKNLSPDFHSYLVDAQKHSKFKKHNYVGVEHFLAAFLSDQKSVLRKILKNNKANWKKKVNDLLDKAFNPQKKGKLWEGYMVTPRIQRIWHDAIQMTQFKDSTEVKEAQFLLLMLEDEESFAFKWLQSEDYNVQRVIESIRDEALSGEGAKPEKKSADKEGEPENEEEAHEKSRAPARKPVEEKKEAELSVAKLFGKTDETPMPRPKPVGARESSFAEKQAGIKIGEREISIQYLTERNLGERIINEIKGIAEALGAFPELLIIGQKEVTFDELIDMSLDDEAFMEVLEIAREHFPPPGQTESPQTGRAGDRPRGPAEQIRPVQDMPTVMYKMPPEKGTPPPQPPRRYETRELDINMINQDYVRLSRAKIEEVQEYDEIANSGHKTREVPKEIINKAKHEIERQAFQAATWGVPPEPREPAAWKAPEPEKPAAWKAPEPREPAAWKPAPEPEKPAPWKAAQEPEKPVSWKIDPFGIGQTEESLPEMSSYQGSTSQSLKEYQTQPSPELASPFPEASNPFGAKKPDESLPPIFPYQEEASQPVRGYRAESIPESGKLFSPKSEPTGAARQEESLPSIFPYQEEVKSPRTDASPEPGRQFSPKPDPFGISRSDESLPPIFPYQEETKGPRADASPEGGKLFSPKSDSFGISKPAEPMPPVFPHHEETKGFRSEPLPEIEKQAPKGEPPGIIQESIQETIIRREEPRFPSFDSTPLPPEPVFTESMPSVRTMESFPTPETVESTAVPVPEIPSPEPEQKSFKPAPELLEPPETPYYERAVSPVYQQKPLPPINADIMQDPYAAREQAATTEPVEITMVGLKKKITTLELFDMILQKESKPGLFDDEFGDGPAAVGASESPIPEFSAKKTFRTDFHAPETAHGGKTLPEPPGEKEKRTAAVQEQVMLGFPEGSRDDHLSMFPVEPMEVDKSTFPVYEGGPEALPGAEALLINTESMTDSYPGELWESNEAEEIAGLVTSSEGHVVLLLRSYVKARKLVKFLKDRVMKEAGRQLYILDTEQFQSLSIDEIAARIDRVKGHLLQKQKLMIMAFDIGSLSKQSPVKAGFEELLNTGYDNDIRYVCSMNQNDFEECWAGNVEVKKRFSPISIKDITTEQAKSFLKTSAPAIEKEIGIKMDPELLEQAAEIAVRFLENPVLPDAILAALKKAATFKREEFEDMGIEEYESLNKKDFLYIVSDASL